MDDLAYKYRWSWFTSIEFDADDPIIIAKDSLKAVYVLDEDNQDKVLQNQDYSAWLSKIYQEESKRYRNKPLELYEFFLEEKC